LHGPDKHLNSIQYGLISGNRIEGRRRALVNDTDKHAEVETIFTTGRSNIHAEGNASSDKHPASASQRQ
jgi:hypothetical protein